MGPAHGDDLLGGRAPVSHFDSPSLTVAIVGGIWDMPSSYRERMVLAPDRVLADGLEAAGLDVQRFGHLSEFRPSRFDVVHVHCPTWGVLRVLQDRSGARFVYTNHLSVPPNRRASYITRAAMRTADCVVALSVAERERIGDLYGVGYERSVVIANGVDPSIFSFSQPVSPDAGPWRLLFVGQLVPMKAVDVLLDAVHKLSEDYDLHVELVYQIAALEGDLRKRVSELGLDTRVNFTGFLDPAKVARRMRESHLLVLPSVGEELPAVITQAMMCGCQVVATDIGSIREQLDTFGVVVAPGDSGALADGIARALETYSDFCAGAADLAHESAILRFSIPAMVQSHIEAYRNVLQKEGPRRVSGSGRRWALAARLAGWIYRPFANHPPVRLAARRR